MLWFRFCISVYIIIASSSWDQNKPEFWCIAHTTLIISINQDLIFFIINYYFCLRDGKNLPTLALSDPNNCCLRYPQGGRRRWTTLDAPTSSTTTTALHSGNGLLTCMLEQALVWSTTPKKTELHHPTAVLNVCSPGMWSPRQRMTINSSRSIKKHTAFSVQGATSVKTWRMSTWSPGTWTTWEKIIFTSPYKQPQGCTIHTRLHGSIIIVS